MSFCTRVSCLSSLTRLLLASLPRLTNNGRVGQRTFQKGHHRSARISGQLTNLFVIAGERVASKSISFTRISHRVIGIFPGSGLMPTFSGASANTLVRQPPRKGEMSKALGSKCADFPSHSALTVYATHACKIVIDGEKAVGRHIATTMLAKREMERGPAGPLRS
jgi:hypothetical protein